MSLCERCHCDVNSEKQLCDVCLLETGKAQFVLKSILNNAKGQLFFTEPTGDMDGWYLWRNNKDWPQEEYRFVEVCDGTMIDEQVKDKFGSEWMVVECEPYGEFCGPLMNR